MTKRNPHFSTLKPTYLFPEINQRKQQYLAQHAHAELISLGIGDTTEPIPATITEGLIKGATLLGTKEGYTGYAQEQGQNLLRERVAEKIYGNRIAAHEVFISDGAKCDIGRLQTLFGGDVSIAVQDPAYPVYVEGSMLHGVKKICYMPCTPENHFFPSLETAPPANLIYFCSPNNPTGAVANHAQLRKLIQFAKAHQSIILFDSAYAHYIQDPSLPRSIYEIEGAQEVAIEMGSFSKIAGFTGVRLGWTVVPEKLLFEDGTPVIKDWTRLFTTLFNGASNIAQHGGIAALSDQGFEEMQQLTRFYLENARLIVEGLKHSRLEIYGGTNAPYVWVRFPGQKSWEVFQTLLEKAQIVTTPGSGFGPAGEGFVRLSAFGQREKVAEAVLRLQKVL
ncbi:LL-diaminopimelate aminotransferase [Parachlamydia sp. AcF125]|uniref:LL-diaminopimelate aminotransferase n=1 Tax=Parachlamydia sp. AcF125 TaxID=2795736 RepID=UPI001BC8CE2B|nr:LL-diaminopimelate aminotransferase [Parachlamydia sp. AcF125]MBS4167921.1 LL-diaminopimelate aminotransferase [Parachlamydia sp. AcF125]